MIRNQGFSLSASLFVCCLRVFRDNRRPRSPLPDWRKTGSSPLDCPCPRPNEKWSEIADSATRPTPNTSSTTMDCRTESARSCRIIFEESEIKSVKISLYHNFRMSNWKIDIQVPTQINICYGYFCAHCNLFIEHDWERRFSELFKSFVNLDGTCRRDWWLRKFRSNFVMQLLL